MGVLVEVKSGQENQPETGHDKQGCLRGSDHYTHPLLEQAFNLFSGMLLLYEPFHRDLTPKTFRPRIIENSRPGSSKLNSQAYVVEVIGHIARPSPPLPLSCQKLAKLCCPIPIEVEGLAVDFLAYCIGLGPSHYELVDQTTSPEGTNIHNHGIAPAESSWVPLTYIYCPQVHPIL